MLVWMEVIFDGYVARPLILHTEFIILPISNLGVWPHDEVARNIPIIIPMKTETVLL